MYCVTSWKQLSTRKGRVRESYAQEKASKQRDAAHFCRAVMTYEGGYLLFLIFVCPPPYEGGHRTSTHSIGFRIKRVCISSSSSPSNRPLGTDAAKPEWWR